jgi:IclR family acetate operon transcriptional repressor
MPERTLSTVRNAVRALQILAERGPLRLSALARELELGKSTAHLLLHTLHEDGMVDFDPVSSTYRVGLRVFEIGATAVEQGGFGVRLIGAMEDLARRCNESVSLGVLSAGSVLLLQRIESPEVLRADIRPGTRMPLHASASGKALLATMSDAEFERHLPDPQLPASARLTLRERDALLAEMYLVRAQGYARQIDEFVDGIAAVAAPIFDAGDRPLGALSIAGPVARFNEDVWSRLLLPAASEMSRLCGNGARRTGFPANGVIPPPLETEHLASPSRKEVHARGR